MGGAGILTVARSVLRRDASLWRRWTSSAQVAFRQEAVPLQHVKFEAKAPSGDAQYPPVIVLHGLMASSGTYRSLLKRIDFAPRRDIFALDLRNHGASAHHDDTTYEAMVMDVRRFMDFMGIKQACLLGHSLGGKVAMITALDSSERVSELIVIDIAPHKYEAPPEEDRPTIVALRAMIKTNLEEFRTREEIGVALQAHGVQSEKLRNFLLTNLIPNPDKPGTFRWRVNLAAIARGLPDLLSFPEYDQSSGFIGKTLFVCGGQSHNVRRSDHPEIMRLFPSAKIETVEEAGHWVQADSPARFVETVNSFLSDN